jgi:hypothetical protein
VEEYFAENPPRALSLLMFHGNEKRTVMQFGGL